MENLSKQFINIRYAKRIASSEISDTSVPTMDERFLNYDNKLKGLFAEYKITPEVFTIYCLNECDILVDVDLIIVKVQSYFDDVSKTDIVRWLKENKEEHHSFI